MTFLVSVSGHFVVLLRPIRSLANEWHLLLLYDALLGVGSMLGTFGGVSAGTYKRIQHWLFQEMISLFLGGSTVETNIRQIDFSVWQKLGGRPTFEKGLSISDD